MDRNILITSVCLIALAIGCTNPAKGDNLFGGNLNTIVGGAIGGLVGNNFGRGDGRTAAVVGSAIIGSILGSNYNNNQRHNVVVSSCNQIQNAGVRSACERGVAERNMVAQRNAELAAYQCARWGRCNNSRRKIQSCYGDYRTGRTVCY